MSGLLDRSGRPIKAANGTSGKRFSMSKIVDGTHEKVRAEMQAHWHEEIQKIVPPWWRWLVLHFPPLWYIRLINLLLWCVNFALVDWMMRMRRGLYAFGTRTEINPTKEKIVQRIYHWGKLVNEREWRVW